MQFCTTEGPQLFEFVCNRGDTILHHGGLHTDLNQCNQGSYANHSLFEFDVATCRTCRLRSKTAILEVAMSNLQK